MIGIDPPIFLSYPLFQDAVKVVLLNEHRLSEWVKINVYFKENKYITNEQARGVTRVKHRDKMSYMLRRWVDQGLLIQIISPSGFKRGTKYKLPAVADMKEIK